MRGTSINAIWVPLVLFFIASFTLSLLPSALSAEGDDTNLLYRRIKDISKILAPDVEQNLAYCVEDLDADWNKAFEFDNLDFLSKCIKTSKGDVTKRLCSAAEIRYYFEESSGDEYVKPNINCNLSSWVNGCEPGWGCTLNDKDNDQNDDLKKEMPLRTSECEPCCEGFFCPPGLTCMIRKSCPLGSYCPLATLNKTTGMCDPYTYQIPPRNKNHTCGGADMWTDASTSNSIFCSPGSYCPTNTEKLSCSSGHFCRMGSTAQLCKIFDTCESSVKFLPKFKYILGDLLYHCISAAIELENFEME